MGNALKKITTEAKRLKREFPHKFDRSKNSWRKYTQWASERYNSGKIGAAKKRKPARAKPVKKKAKRSAPKKRKRASKRKTTVSVVRKTRTTKVRARRVGSVPKPTRRRMAGSGGNGLKKLLPVALLVGAGLLLWKALAPKAPTVPPGAPPLLTTQNSTRNQQSSDIVQYAVAAGLTIDAISKLITSLNSRGDNDVRYIYDELDRGGDLPVSLYA